MPPDSGVKYLIDTSVLVNIQEMKTDSQKVWDFIFEEVDAGRLKTVRHVFDECERRFKDVYAIIKPYKEKMMTPDSILYSAEATQEIREIGTHHPKLYKKLGNNNSADPFLIAVGKTIGATVITSEKKEGHGYKSRIPYVCKQRNVGCSSMKEFLGIIFSHDKEE